MGKQESLSKYTDTNILRKAHDSYLMIAIVRSSKKIRAEDKIEIMSEEINLVSKQLLPSLIEALPRIYS
jgi:hypothetical protein